jgi:hypothetical protein
MKRPLIVVLMVVFAVALLGCYHSERKASNEIVAKVEQFKKSSGRLPEALSEIGVKENESCPCYCKTSNDSYIVWYGTTLGESDTFDSRSRRWSEVNIACSR